MLRCQCLNTAARPQLHRQPPGLTVQALVNTDVHTHTQRVCVRVFGTVVCVCVCVFWRKCKPVFIIKRTDAQGDMGGEAIEGDLC